MKPGKSNLFIATWFLFCMQTKSSSMLLVVLCTLLTSSAQVLYKFGADKLELSFSGIITNHYILFGLLFYGIGAILLITALKHGELTVLYPIIATSYIWVALMSWYFFNESMNPLKWLGILTIIVGIIFITSNTKESLAVTA